MLFIDEDASRVHTYEYSTVKGISDQADNLLAPPAVESVAVDRDNDGQID